MVETNYNSNSPNNKNNLDDPKEVGPNASLEVAGGGEVPVSNVSFSEEANTSEVQYTDSFSQSIAVTGVSYSGSFEIPGNANTVRAFGWDEPSSGTSTPNYIGTITITDSNTSYTFHNVLLNSHSKDIPSDDRTTQSFDFMAERLTVG